MNAKTEAIANADAHLNDAGLPTYSELVSALRDICGMTHENSGDALKTGRALIRAAEAA